MNPDEDTNRDQHSENIVLRSLGVTRFFVILGVISSVLLSISLYLSTVIKSITGIWFAYTNISSSKDTTKVLLLLAVEQADGLLVATALLITGFGLYSLFIGRPKILPLWLQISSIDELKTKLIGVVVAALAVNFFSAVYEIENSFNLLVMGFTSSIVIAALGFFLKNKDH